MSKDEKTSKLSTEPYKGVRDFYPEDLYTRTRLFKTMGGVAKSYGYVEIDSSPLEPTELYTAKSSEEIVNEQTYTFTDRGGRSVTLRPEMTPSVTRMVANKRRELTLPLRWYSIGNMFRYERPQRGRLREHAQLNVDIFGVYGIEAEVEIISMMADIMYVFGATDDDFVIRVNSRKLLNAFLVDHLALDNKVLRNLMRLIDGRRKMKPGEFDNKLHELVGDHREKMVRFLDAEEVNACTQELPDIIRDMDGIKELKELLKSLDKAGLHCVKFDPSLVRGFDYYTGTVFEIFDTNPKNSRSLFGGGRYDHLVEMFGVDQVPAVGFAMGDVGIRDFLEVRGLLPEYEASAQLYICTTDDSFLNDARALAKSLRKSGVNVEVDLSSKRVGDQVRVANKNSVPFVVCVGEEEIKNKKYTVKELATSTETKLKESELKDFILKNT